MCGIAGYCLNMKDKAITDRARLTAALLSAIEERGQHATGMSWWDTCNTDGRIRVRKQAVSATEYIRSGRVSEEITPGVRTALLHTRYATQGSAKVNGNNHPIMAPPVVGVHNGHISNDDALFKRLGVPRSAEVDSEAAFALLAHDPAPVTELLPRIEGRAAIAWMDKREITDTQGGPTLHLSRIEGSPLAVGMTSGGSFLFASTMHLLHKACADAGIDGLDWELEFGEYEYMRVRRGKVLEYTTYGHLVNRHKPAAKKPNQAARQLEWKVGRAS